MEASDTLKLSAAVLNLDNTVPAVPWAVVIGTVKPEALVGNGAPIVTPLAPPLEPQYTWAVAGGVTAEPGLLAVTVPEAAVPVRTAVAVSATEVAAYQATGVTVTLEFAGNCSVIVVPALIKLPEQYAV
jgi:hypothetical protein